MVAFPGGFGTLDELFEILTLLQTRKLGREICLVLYGREYWNEIVNFPALVRHGMIAASDLDLIHVLDTPAEAMQCLRQNVAVPPVQSCPALAKSLTSHCGSNDT
jgi:predicted Rossmann-fold nucleotide-binding protein